MKGVKEEQLWLHSLKSQYMETSLLTMPCSTQVQYFMLTFYDFCKAKLFYLKLFTQTQYGSLAI